MKSIRFILPLIRIDSTKVGKGVVRALEEAFGKRVAEAVDVKATVDPYGKVEIVCEAEAFANFVILRNRYGGQNLIKELEPIFETDNTSRVKPKLPVIDARYTNRESYSDGYPKNWPYSVFEFGANQHGKTEKMYVEMRNRVCKGENTFLYTSSGACIHVYGRKPSWGVAPDGYTTTIEADGSTRRTPFWLNFDRYGDDAEQYKTYHEVFHALQEPMYEVKWYREPIKCSWSPDQHEQAEDRTLRFDKIKHRDEVLEDAAVVFDNLFVRAKQASADFNNSSAHRAGARDAANALRSSANKLRGMKSAKPVVMNVSAVDAALKAALDKRPDWTVEANEKYKEKLRSSIAEEQGKVTVEKIKLNTALRNAATECEADAGVLESKLKSLKVRFYNRDEREALRTRIGALRSMARDLRAKTVKLP